MFAFCVRHGTAAPRELQHLPCEIVGDILMSSASPRRTVSLTRRGAAAAVAAVAAAATTDAVDIPCTGNISIRTCLKIIVVSGIW